MTDDRQDRLRATSPSEAEERVQKDPAELVAVVAREMAEPRDGVAPTPVTILLLFFVLAGWGGYYIANESGGFRADVYDENFREGREDAEAPKVKDPMVLGRRTFNVCTQCHQETGAGIPGTYPPLDGSEIVVGDEATLVRIVLHGLQGPVTVAGATYEGQMPAWDRLSDEQIAAVLTYIRGSWRNRAQAIDTALVATIRKQFSTRTQAWTWAELQQAKQQKLNPESSRNMVPPK
jgi:mono/diheme cytochrome c family protein